MQCAGQLVIALSGLSMLGTGAPPPEMAILACRLVCLKLFTDCSSSATTQMHTQERAVTAGADGHPGVQRFQPCALAGRICVTIAAQDGSAVLKMCCCQSTRSQHPDAKACAASGCLSCFTSSRHLPQVFQLSLSVWIVPSDPARKLKVLVNKNAPKPIHCSSTRPNLIFKGSPLRGLPSASSMRGPSPALAEQCVLPHNRGGAATRSHIAACLAWPRARRPGMPASSAAP